MELILVSILFLGIIAVQEWRHEREKKAFREQIKDLWNRLMARDFREYITLVKPKTHICLPGNMTDEEMAEEEEKREKQKVG